MRRLIPILIAAIAACVLLLALFRRSSTDQIMDGGNMENPFVETEEVRPLLPESCRLLSLSWSQNAMLSDDCYSFSLTGGPDAPLLECSFSDGGGYERISIGSEAEADEDRSPRPVSAERWAQLERLLREMSLPEYQAPDPNLSDASVNRLSIESRSEDGTVSGADFDGTDALPLLELLMDTARETASEK